ncbi:MAG: hypothetical protein AAGA03_15960 [Planctomycetota bacterium]
MSDRSRTIDLAALNHQRSRRVLFALSAAMLIGVSAWVGRSQADPESHLLAPVAGSWLVEIAGQIGLALAIHVLVCSGLGALGSVAIVPPAQAATPKRRLWLWFWSIIVTILIALTARILISGRPWMPPSHLTIVVIAAGCWWGNWLGTTWLGRSSNLNWFVRQAFVTLITIPVIVAVFGWLAFTSAPLDLDTPAVSTKARQALVQKLRQYDPRKLPVGQTQRLSLSQREVNQLLAWGINLLPGDHAARVDLRQDRVTLRLTLQSPIRGWIDRFLNVQASGRIIAHGGELGFCPSELSVGSLHAPSWMLQFSGPFLIRRSWLNESIEPFFDSLESIQLGDRDVAVTYRNLDVRKGFVRDALVGLGLAEDFEPAAIVYVTDLLALAEAEPSVDFAKCLQTLMTRAKKRSARSEASAVHENRAAIASLGYVLGHHRIRTWIGSDVPSMSPQVRSVFRRVSLRGRADWTRHFTVSAALQTLGNSMISKDIGILKEELDSFGGSGFSFGDLLADRAGTRLGVEATSSEASARRIQDRIAEGIHESDVMPPGGDLQEGLTNEQFRKVYGGVTGDAYRRTVATIDQRIAELPLYRLSDR